MEREIPARVQQSLQQSLNDHRAHCPDCRLAMHRHHRYPRSIMTRYGELQLKIPVFRCGECRRMVSGMELLGEEEHHRRYSKNPRVSRQTGHPGIELRPGRPVGGQREKHPVPLGAAGVPGVA